MLAILLATADVADAACSPALNYIVNKMYRQALDRNPDSGGLKAYCCGLQRGRTVSSLFKSFAKSTEFKNKFVYGKSTFFAIANIYKVILNRCPDAGGLLAWERQLRPNCRGNFDSIVDKFFDSAEYKNKFGAVVVAFLKPQTTCPGRPDVVSNVVVC